MYRLFDEFMCNTVIGNFELRLSMIKFIAEEFGGESRIRMVAMQVLNYYKLFLSKLLDVQTKEKKMFAEEMEEYMKLAGWNSSN